MVFLPNYRHSHTQSHRPTHPQVQQKFFFNLRTHLHTASVQNECLMGYHI
uniref:Uncharacterized protein n=1 Tax=Anguilla anguilla TaxID=7936 RepID=A0A0E9WAC4_ANGAN